MKNKLSGYVVYEAPDIGAHGMYWKIVCYPDGRISYQVSMSGKTWIELRQLTKEEYLDFEKRKVRIE